MSQQVLSPQQKDTQPNRSSSNRGFSSMDPAQQRAIASKGGKAAHQKGTAHEFTPEEAALAGRKGGEAVSRDRQHMATIGAEGGRASHSSGLHRANRSPEPEPKPNAAPSP